MKIPSGVPRSAPAVTRRDDTSGCIGDEVDLGSRCLLTSNKKSDLSFARLSSIRGSGTVACVRTALNTYDDEAEHTLSHARVRFPYCHLIHQQCPTYPVTQHSLPVGPMRERVHDCSPDAREA